MNAIPTIFYLLAKCEDKPLLKPNTRHSIRWLHTRTRILRCQPIPERRVLSNYFAICSGDILGVDESERNTLSLCNYVIIYIIPKMVRKHISFSGYNTTLT
jgi:hypothetical protein